MILVDPCVWSLAFRRPRARVHTSPAVRRLRRLVDEDVPVGIPGIVLQELLSGVRDESEVERLLAALEGFPCRLATRAIHVRAARLWNRCRRGGVAAGSIDCLIAATCEEAGAALLTTDRDFEQIAEHSSLRLLLT